MPTPRTHRELRTVLITDIVESTKTAARQGDRLWHETLDAHDAATRAELARAGGHEVGKRLGDGFLATFDSPEKAVRCAEAIGEAVRELKLEIRAGVHTGECEIRGKDVGGIAVHIGARIVELAEPEEILVSQTVKDLVTGAKLSFTSRGSHTLRGVPGKWRLYALKQTTQTRAPATKPVTRPKRKSIGILIVDDHPLWRQTLRQVIEHKKAGTIVGEASDGSEAIESARRLVPDVVVMDMDLPKTNGVEATQTILQELPETKVLFLSAEDSREKVLEAVEAGASGYLIKTAEPSEIVDAVRRVNTGEAVFTPSLAAVVLDEFRRLSAGKTRKRGPLDALTDRERDVLRLMAEGRSNLAIGQALYLSPKTVETHVARIFQKLDLTEAPDDHRRVLAVVTYLRSA